MDTFYSSVVLYIALLKRGIMACGTILLRGVAGIKYTRFGKISKIRFVCNHNI